MTAAPDRRVRTRMEPEARQDQILACARRLFGERPYSAVSLTDIANEAGVARGLVNHYFGGKRQLYVEVLRGMVIPPEWAVERLPKGDVEERVAAIIERFLTVVERNRGIWLVTVDAMSQAHDREMEQVMRDAQEVTVDRLLEALDLHDLGAGEGPLRAMVRTFGSMARSATYEWLNRGTLTRDETARLLEGALLLIVRDRSPR